MEAELVALRGKPPKVKPTFKYRDEYLKGIEKIFSLFITDEASREFLSCTLICRDSKTLLSGGYGTGKTTFIEMAAKMFYSSQLGIVRSHQELTTFDILWALDIQKFIQSKIGAITPRSLITAPFKFINEVQRLNTQCQNALLELLSDKHVVFSDVRAESPDYVCFLDMNPHDIGTVGLVRALMDRIDFSLNITPLGTGDTTELLVIKYGDRHVDDLRTLAEPVLTYEQMTEIWSDVERVWVSRETFHRISLLATLLRRCVRVERSVMSSRYKLSHVGCPFYGEVCMDLIMPLAHRWVDSSVKLSKARAWLQARDEIYFDDILWAMTYTLPHRLELTQSVFAKYPNEAAWVSQRLRESVTLKESLWDEALKFLAPALNGDKAALAKLSEMGSKDLAVGGLFEWVEERLLERKEKEAKAR
ncbi:AAA family ATPase [Candidatus Hecatella orcuttiae]|uniref:AAA family ATPase n=1 Tax=Candidatus Hecatella orcuttiae TaxID=1935119 RepID=UPI002867E439|nr:AAA family ATPase [Candidatus Hecatella orcuttiae]